VYVTNAAQWGLAIRQARRAKGWTQAELAGRIGANRKWVIAVESGSLAVRADLLVAACDHLDLLVDLVPDAWVNLRDAVLGPAR
jgi:transcriptional regulator with XRE-family HTH domain